MKKLSFVVALIFIATPLLAQKSNQKNQKNEIRVPLKAENWTSKHNKTTFADHKGVPSMELTTGDELLSSKDIAFGIGTIEFDLELKQGFAGMYFRYENENNSELVYVRQVENPMTDIAAIQYTPILKGVNMWDMMYHYQTSSSWKIGEWAHFKLVISANQMLVYVNDMTTPNLEIPKLEGDTTTGGLAFFGSCFIANLVLKPNETGGLGANAGFDPMHHDNKYIRSWQVSEPMPLPVGKELSNDVLPDIQTKWTKINAERRGLINLSRVHGNSTERRFVWLRTKIISKKEEKRDFDLGFSDEVWVFLNGSLVYVDKSLFGQGMRKKPDGRIGIDNSKFELPLKEGENELLIGLSNDFYGWGIMAHVDNMNGLDVNTDFKPEVINKEFEQYFGTYASTKTPLKLKISQKNDKLTAAAQGQSSFPLESAGNGVFKMDQYGITIQFVASEKKLNFKQGSFEADFIKE